MVEDAKGYLEAVEGQTTQRRKQKDKQCSKNTTQKTKD